MEITVVMGCPSGQIANRGAAQRTAEAVEYRRPLPRVDNRPIAAPVTLTRHAHPSRSPVTPASP